MREHPFWPLVALLLLAANILSLAHPFRTKEAAPSESRTAGRPDLHFPAKSTSRTYAS